MSPFDFLAVIICALITWRVASFAVYEKGPYDAFARLRDFLGVGYDEQSKCTAKGRLGGLVSMLCCFKCTSVWIAWLVTALFIYTPWPLAYIGNVLSVSAVAIMVNSFVNGRGV